MVAAFGGCDGSRAGGVRDIGVDESDRADAAVAEAGASNEAGPSSTRPEPSGRPLPPGVAPARMLLPRDASLTGDSLTSCSHQRAGGSADRWCVFSVAAAGAVELWVINVTGAAAGEIPRCDGSDVRCVRLTSNLWAGFGPNGPWHPHSHRFYGDTLLFYAHALSGPAGVYRGPVFAWRPDWTQARQISSPVAMQCWAHEAAPIAHCVEDLAGDPVAPESFEIRAGPIADKAGIVLPSLGRVRVRRSDGLAAWHAGFSPAGDVFAVSSLDPDPTVETLRTVATNELGQATLAPRIRDATAWQISHDGRRVYFLRDEAPGRQALFVADFPTGANVTRLDVNVSEYQVLGGRGQDQGVGFIAELGPGEQGFRLLRDAGVPGSARTIFAYQEPPMSRRVSPDGRFTAWADHSFRLRVVEHEGLASCVANMNARLPAYSAAFLDGAGLMFWAEDAGGDRDRRDGYLANPLGCAGKQRFARSLYFAAPIGDRGLVFADEVDDQTQRATLKYAAITDGSRWPADGAVRIYDDIDGPSVVPAAWDPLLLLFRISSGPPEQQGTYLFGPAPF